MTTLNLMVGGMTCDGCERSVSNALARLEGVREVEASHHTGAVRITADHAIAREILVEAVEDAGYDVLPEGKTALPMA